jgi:hypothetical protein
MPVRVELHQEQRASFRLVSFSDLVGRGPQLVECSQKTTVGLVGPTDISASTPSAPPQAIQSAVIADAGGGISLNRISTELAQAGPRVEKGRESSDDRGDGITTSRCRFQCECLGECLQRFRRLGIQPGFWKAGRQGDGSLVHRVRVCHLRMLTLASADTCKCVV